MASSDKSRIPVFLVFFILLIVFGMFYRPMDSSSRLTGAVPGNPGPPAHPADTTDQK